MAEWFKRGTVNTFYRGSNPLKTLNYYTRSIFGLKFYLLPLNSNLKYKPLPPVLRIKTNKQTNKIKIKKSYFFNPRAKNKKKKILLF